ncbi:MAG: hypothetical protein NT101_04160 [Actinobacteria bacterium]|nr:hypothetical protein [Actinomycetota bacterium]
MSYFEECLRLGEWLSEADRRALYRYLLESNKENYKAQANLLLENSSLNKRIANGEVIYTLQSNQVTYKARKIGSIEFSSEMRKMQLMGIQLIDTQRLRKFFAQSDVDVIQNFPLPGENQESEGGFCVDTFPYYTLAYYANGGNPIKGLIKKIRTNDKDILTKLRTL